MTTALVVTTGELPSLWARREAQARRELGMVPRSRARLFNVRVSPQRHVTEQRLLDVIVAARAIHDRVYVVSPYLVMLLTTRPPGSPLPGGKGRLSLSLRAYKAQAPE